MEAKGQQDKKRKRDEDKKRAGEVKAAAPADTNTDASVSRRSCWRGEDGGEDGEQAEEGQAQHAGCQVLR